MQASRDTNQSQEPARPSNQQSGPDRPGAVLLAGIMAGIVVTAFSLSSYWSLPTWGLEKWQEVSAIVRNFGLVTVGIPALWLAWHRTRTATRQADTANEQARIANKQAELAEKGLIIDRYQKGAQMLESNDYSVRLAGIYALRDLALKEPKQSLPLVVQLICDFARERSFLWKIEDGERADEGYVFRRVPRDLDLAYRTFGRLSGATEEWITDAERRNYRFSFAGGYLPGMLIHDCAYNNCIYLDSNLSTSIYQGVAFNNTSFLECNFQDCVIKNTVFDDNDITETDFRTSEFDDVTFKNTKLEEIDFTDTTMTRVSFHTTTLNRVNFSGAEFREIYFGTVDDAEALPKIDMIWAYENNPPQNMPKPLEDAICYRKKDEPWDDFVARIEEEK